MIPIVLNPQQSSMDAESLRHRPFLRSVLTLSLSLSGTCYMSIPLGEALDLISSREHYLCKIRLHTGIFSALIKNGWYISHGLILDIYLYIEYPRCCHCFLEVRWISAVDMFLLSLWSKLLRTLLGLYFFRVWKSSKRLQYYYPSQSGWREEPPIL